VKLIAPLQVPGALALPLRQAGSLPRLFEAPFVFAQGKQDELKPGRYIGRARGRVG
jgi:hypothetical protein